MLYDAVGAMERLAVSVAEAGTATLKAAQSAKKIRVLGGVLVAGGAGATFTLKSGTTAILGPIVLAANATFVLPTSGIGYCETAASAAFVLDVSAGAVSGVLTAQTIK